MLTQGCCAKVIHHRAVGKDADENQTFNLLQLYTKREKGQFFRTPITSASICTAEQRDVNVFIGFLFLMIQSRCVHAIVVILERKKRRNFTEKYKTVHQGLSTVAYLSYGQIMPPKLEWSPRYLQLRVSNRWIQRCVFIGSVNSGMLNETRWGLFVIV